MWIFIFGSESGFGDDFGQYDTKHHYFTKIFGQTPLRNSVVMATPKVPGDQKLFERVCLSYNEKIDILQNCWKPTSSFTRKQQYDQQTSKTKDRNKVISFQPRWFDQLY